MQSALASRAATLNDGVKKNTIFSDLRLADGYPQNVLEMGKAIGAHRALQSGRGHAYTVLDISSQLLKQAAQRIPDGDRGLLVAGDATRMPFRGGTSDAAFCVATIHHLPNPEQGVAEISRALRKGGSICILEPKSLYPTQLIQFLRHPETEVTAVQVTVRLASEWAREARALDDVVTYQVFTPDVPTPMISLYEVFDRICAHSRMLQWLSIMFRVSGTSARTDWTSS